LRSAPPTKTVWQPAVPAAGESRFTAIRRAADEFRDAAIVSSAFAMSSEPATPIMIGPLDSAAEPSGQSTRRRRFTYIAALISYSPAASPIGEAAAAKTIAVNTRIKTMESVFMPHARRFFSYPFRSADCSIAVTPAASTADEKKYPCPNLHPKSRRRSAAT